jgi:poly-gamma-glutamate capsule biosynthesis protein CapA/YwtB (metallophosphatase superfamily)
MKRDLSTEEARDQKIAQLTNAHLSRRLGDLIRGDQNAIRTVDEALSHELCKPEVMEQLIMLAVTDQRHAGAKLCSLIEQVVRADAEYDAIKEVEQMERDCAASVAEACAEQNAFVRLVMNQ